MVPDMKQLKWSSGVLFLVILALLYLVPYSIFVRHPHPGVTEIYFADRITEAHLKLIDRYNQSHAGTVKVIPIDFPNLDFSTNERKEILARSLRGEGDGIDLLAVDLIWVKRFSKWCEPLGQFFSEEELRRILPNALLSCYDEGNLVAVPFDLDQSVLYYREDLLRKFKGADKMLRMLQDHPTWPAFLALRDQLNWKGPFYIFPAADYEGLICCYLEILLSLKQDYFSTIGFNFNTQQGKQALQLLVDLVHKHGVTPPIVTTFTELPSYEYFIKNDGLFIRGWTTYDKDFKSQPYDREKEQHLRKAPIPHLPGGAPASMVGGWDLMLSQYSKKKEAAIDFVKYLLRDDSQEMLYAEGGFFPVVSSFYSDSLSLRRYPEISGIKDLMRTSVHRPADKGYTSYSKIMSHYFSLAIKNKISVSEAVERVTQAIESERTIVAMR
jgi:multiple sugar transport system substrate-binding protein